MGLSQLSCADWPLARVVNSGAWVGPGESAWGKEFGTGVWGVFLALLKQHWTVGPLPHPRCHSVDWSVRLHPLCLFCKLSTLLKSKPTAFCWLMVTSPFSINRFRQVQCPTEPSSEDKDNEVVQTLLQGAHRFVRIKRSCMEQCYKGPIWLC